MREALIGLLGILIFCTCSKENKVPYTGTLEGKVSYTSAINKEMDNVIITIRQLGESVEKSSERISKSGDYSFKFPAGKYVMTLEGNLCYSKHLPDTVSVKIGESTKKDINIELLLSFMVILHNKNELASDSTMILENGDALVIWNKYSETDLEWKIRAAYPSSSTPKWISFEDSTGTVAGKGHRPVVFHIDKDKLPNYGYNDAIIILTTTNGNGGSFTVTIRAMKEGGEPSKASVTGKKENDCPETSVKLIADADNADSYVWYKEDTLVFSGGDTYLATASGIYYAAGVNAIDTGRKSNGWAVTISSCNKPPSKPEISGAERNICPASSVTLTANADGATSYKWYKNGSPISGENTNIYIAKSNGSYSAAGVNANGTGMRSEEKTVTINSCPSIPSINASPSSATNNCPNTTVTLTAKSTNATEYKWYKNSTLLEEKNSTLIVFESGIYYAKGINMSGDISEMSLPKTVTISSCLPDNPANASISEYEQLGYINLSWSSVSSATSYKIQICNTSSMTGCENNYYSVTGTSRRFKPNELFCGDNYFKIIAVNAAGESSGSSAFYRMTPSISAGKNLYITFNYTSRQYTLSYIEADVRWYNGIIYFDIYRQVGNGERELIHTLSVHSDDQPTLGLNYSDNYNNVSESVSYWIKARIVSTCGEFSDWSN